MIFEGLVGRLAIVLGSLGLIPFRFIPRLMAVLVLLPTSIRSR